MRTILFAFVVTPLCVGSATAGDWVQRELEVRPPARHDHAMAYDPHREVTVMFGGRVFASDASDDMTEAPVGDLWEWDGTRWIERESEVGPTPRYGHAMAYCPDLEAVVVVAGTGLSEPGQLPWSDETWAWNGTSWRLLSEDVPWTFLARPQMVYDRQRQQLVLRSSERMFVWDGETWEEKRPMGRAPTGFGRMVQDGKSGKVLLMQSNTDTFPVTEEVWEWRGTRWRKRSRAPEGEGPGSYGYLVYDSKREVIVCAGRDLYLAEFDGRTWSEGDRLPVSYRRRQGYGFVFDAAREQLVLFGGRLGDAWNLGEHDGRDVETATLFAQTWTLDPGE
ncbi:hypothetical protein OAX78_01035 [Planctomycetota bacterium]|nr:hypothetical protein [Planctomycetota bacterium]